jgi:hypothetical protein
MSSRRICGTTVSGLISIASPSISSTGAAAEFLWQGRAEQYYKRCGSASARRLPVGLQDHREPRITLHFARISLRGGNAFSANFYRIREL